jgi:site-specific recombinase XerD
MNIFSLSEQFCEYSRYIRGYSPETIRRYRAVINLLARRSGISDIEQCSEDIVRALFYRGRLERHWSAATFVTYHKSLVVFFRWCVQHGYLAANPTDGIEVPKSAKPLPPKLGKQDAARVLEFVENYPYPYRFQRYRNHAVLATFMLAGLRKAELLRLKVEDMDLENRSIFVRRGKGAKDRVVPMSATLAGTLRRYVDERERLKKSCPEFFASLNRNCGLTDTGLKRLMQAVRRATGLHVTAHRLRHTFATLMLEGGCDIFSLSRMMGHSDIKTTTIYLAATAEHLRSQMAKHPLNHL